MSLTMQAILANTFAACMTFAVIIFPTPKDFMEVILASPEQIEAHRVSVPDMVPLSKASLDGMRPVASLGTELKDDQVKTLAACAYYLERAENSERVEICRQTVIAVSESRLDWESAIRGEAIDPLAEQLLFTAYQLCRHEWSSLSNLPEMPAVCRQSIVGLAS